MLDINVNRLKNRLYITYSPYPELNWDKSLFAIKNAAGKLSPADTREKAPAQKHKSA